MDTIGKRVRARRKQLELTQVDPSLRAGIKQPTLSQIEKDQTKEMEASTLETDMFSTPKRGNEHLRSRTNGRRRLAFLASLRVKTRNRAVPLLVSAVPQTPTDG